MTLLPEPTPLYRNVLEPLVNAEVTEQLQQMSPRLVKYLYPDQITALALNRLPALYTTSREHWMQQQQRAQEELAPPIALRQGLTAVQRDSLKAGTLLPCVVSSQSFPITALLA